MTQALPTQQNDTVDWVIRFTTRDEMLQALQILIKTHKKPIGWGFQENGK